MHHCIAGMQKKWCTVAQAYGSLIPGQSRSEATTMLLHEAHLSIANATKGQTMDQTYLQDGLAGRKAATTTAGRDLQLDTSNIALSKAQYDEIVLDGSGSMADQWWDMLAAIDGYVDQLRINQLESHIRLSVFTTGPQDAMDLVARNTPIATWEPLLTNPIGSHFGMTPLYDAIALAGMRLQKLDPARASLLIVTDGGENGSKFTSLEQARAILEWCKAKGWQVTFHRL